MSTRPKVIAQSDTDRQNITSTAYAGGKNRYTYQLQEITSPIDTSSSLLCYNKFDSSQEPMYSHWKYQLSSGVYIQIDVIKMLI